MKLDNISSFKQSLRTLKGRTHGDTLAIYLALKYYQDKLPIVGDNRDGVTSSFLENLLDTFYAKRHAALKSDNGKVCRIFHNAFTPYQSNSQNNWRDFFRYGLGVGCLASESELSGPFLIEHRSKCKYLGRNSNNDPACQLHYLQTKYIRGLDKPKLLHWKLNGKKGTYKVVNLDYPLLAEIIRPLSSRVPLTPLIEALYFGATWNVAREVTIDQFVSDFHFEDREQVEYLFAVETEDRATREVIELVKQDIRASQNLPFSLTGEAKTRLSTSEQKIRSRAFTEYIRDAYDHTCAVCGLRLDTPDGKWEVQAAHIYPKRLFGSDDVRNGIALCHNHHWAFDQYIFTIDTGYELVWTEKAKHTPVHVKGKLRLPAKVEQWPDQKQALAWHRAQFMSQDNKGPRTS